MTTAATLVEASKVWADRKAIAMKRNSSVEEHVMKMNTLNAKLDHLLRPEIMAVDICPVFVVVPNTNHFAVNIATSMQASGLFVIRGEDDIKNIMPFADYKIELLYNRPLYSGESNRSKDQVKTDTFIYLGKTYGSIAYYDLHKNYYESIRIPPPWTTPDRHGIIPKFVTQKTVRLLPAVVPVENLKPALEEALTKRGFDVLVEPMIGPSVLYELSRDPVMVPVPVTEYRIHFMSVKGF